MRNISIKQHHDRHIANDGNQKGSAIVIALFVLALISVFVALALSRSASEAAAVGNETGEGRTFYAAQGSLETMTRNFNKVFEVKLNPTTIELNAVRNGAVNGLAGFTFTQELDQTSIRQNVTLTGGPFAGLYSIRDNWRLRSTATDNSGIQVQLSRNVLNNRIPIFQFGIFYDDDLELYRPPRFAFGGRVHTNGNFFISPGSAGVYFNSRVTAVGQIVTQTWRNGNQSDINNNQTFIKNASGVDQQLLPDQGSVLNTTAGAADNIFQFPPAAPLPVPTPNLDLPPSRLNPNWATQSAIFDGNLQNRVQELKLPIKIDNALASLIESVKRGKKTADSTGGDLYSNAGTLAPVVVGSVDSDILKEERFANKTGIRVSLADSKAKLPGCASGVGTAALTGRCGIRLDGYTDGGFNTPYTGALLTSPTPTATPDRARGYQPDYMKNLSSDAAYNTYKATRVNGERLYTAGTREVWIKVETVDISASTGAVITNDITQDFLSMGVTEQAVRISDSGGTVQFRLTDSSYNDTPLTTSLTATTAQAPPSTAGTDSRAVIKLQRFVIPGPAIPNGATPYSSAVSFTPVAGTPGSFNVVDRFSNATQSKVNSGCLPAGTCTAQDAFVDTDADGIDDEIFAHLKFATIGANTDRAIVPFPIEMYDSREGEWFDDPAKYDATTLTRNGVMSMVNIDVANLRRFLRGDFDNLFKPTTNFPSGLKSTDIPQRQGWVFYVSDRRGDADFDGEYDMEDIYGSDPSGNDGILQRGEDVNFNGLLDAKYMDPITETCLFGVTSCEAPRYADTVAKDLAAVSDHKYYRRGVRLINGTTLPGLYDSVTPTNNRGFTVATENGIYIQGNYNATGVATIPATGNTVYSDYLPTDTPVHIAASVVADAVTILSNAWNDAESLASPYDQRQRVAADTTIRFGMLAGDTLSASQSVPNQGGLSPKLNGGVHNFKRFLESWTDQTGAGAFSFRLNYSGSLINLYNSRNNNGAFKCCNTVYDPPKRNWVFDSTFLDPDRLPPGTPYFQYIQTTGFQRTNN